MKKTFYLIIAMVLVVSCKTNDDTTPNSQSQLDLKGKWSEQTNYKKGQHEGQIREFEFKCNTFYLKLSLFNDALDPLDSCSKTNWNEYARGTYTQKTNILKLDGFYTDSLYNKKASGCYHIGEFKDSFLISFDGELLNLNPVNHKGKIKLLKSGSFNCLEEDI